MSADTPHPPVTPPARRAYFGKRLKPQQKNSAPTVTAVDGELVHDAPIIIHNAIKNSVAQSIRAAREKLQGVASRYVEIHLQSAEKALKNGDYDAARKACEWAMENLSADGDDGKQVRIIAPKDQPAPTLPAIQIGIALGGLPSSDRKQLKARNE